MYEEEVTIATILSSKKGKSDQSPTHIPSTPPASLG